MFAIYVTEKKKKKKKKKDRYLTNFGGQGLLQKYKILKVDCVWDFIYWEKFQKGQDPSASPRRFYAIFRDPCF